MLTFEQREQIQILRDALKMAECLGSASTMREIRRKIRAIERGQDPDAPRIVVERKPRKRVTWSRPGRRKGYFFVRLTCGHLIDSKGVPDRDGFQRAPHTAICPTCNP